MYKIGIIGKRDAVLGFMALGFSVMEAATVEVAKEKLHNAVKSAEYGVILLTEDYAMEMEEDVAKYRDNPIPAIVSVPGPEGSKGYGINHLRAAVERAVGADILFKDEN